MMARVLQFLEVFTRRRRYSGVKLRAVRVRDVRVHRFCVKSVGAKLKARAMANRAMVGLKISISREFWSVTPQDSIGCSLVTERNIAKVTENPRAFVVS